MTRSLLIALWFPMIWLMMVLVHIVFFSTAPGQGFWLGIFDRVVMLSCFLLYPVATFARESLSSSLLPFAIQFLFWWMVSWALQAIYLKIKNRKI